MTLLGQSVDILLDTYLMPDGEIIWPQSVPDFQTHAYGNVDNAFEGFASWQGRRPDWAMRRTASRSGPTCVPSPVNSTKSTACSATGTAPPSQTPAAVVPQGSRGEGQVE